MDPNEVDYLDCAPEIDEAHEAFIDWSEQEALKLDCCTCDHDNECPACRSARLAVPTPIHWAPRPRRVILQEDGLPLMYDDAAIEARIDDHLATRAARKMPQPSRPYTPGYPCERRRA
jgi:hypothetical protein